MAKLESRDLGPAAREPKLTACHHLTGEWALYPPISHPGDPQVGKGVSAGQPPPQNGQSPHTLPEETRRKTSHGAHGEPQALTPPAQTPA